MPHSVAIRRYSGYRARGVCALQSSSLFCTTTNQKPRGKQYAKPCILMRMRQTNLNVHLLQIITVLSTVYSIKEQGDVHAYILATGLMYAHTGKSIILEHALKMNMVYTYKFY